MVSRQTILWTCIALFSLAELLFLVNIQFPRGVNFDEYHYIPAAREAKVFGKHRNSEHPPLGKTIIAAGIAIGGDRPFGWRVMSTLFGAGTLVAVYLLALILFQNQRAALFASWITLFNQMLYVQSRIAMLDTFMVFFIIASLVFFCHIWLNPKSPYKTRFLYGFGVCIGLAIACKWFALVVWMGLLGLVVFCKAQRQYHFNFLRVAGFPRITTKHALGALVATPAVVYLTTFLPLLAYDSPNYSLGDLFNLQASMWNQQMRVGTSHPYKSEWWSWAFMKRPIWYAFDKEGDTGQFVRGVLLLGNPVLIWTGLLGIVACLWGWIQKRSTAAGLIVAFYALFYLSWGVLPRKISFFYYYYPASLVLGLALTYFFIIWIPKSFLTTAKILYGLIVFGVFIYFFPILAALKINSGDFSSWMWLDSWI